MIPGSLCSALLPQLSRLSPAAAGDLYWRNYKRVAVITFGVCVLAAIVIYPVLAWWLSVDFAQKALPIALVLCVGIWLNGMALVPYTLIHANGNSKITALFHVFELFLYMIVLWWLVNHYGLVGAAFAWLARVAIDLALLHYSANIILNKIKK